MALGGARPGAGRPKGSTSKPQIRDYFTEAEIIAFIADLKEKMKTDSILARFVAEQLFGKAPQRMELTGKDGKDLPIPIFGNVQQHNSDNQD